MSQNYSRRQKAAKWAGKVSFFAAKEYLWRNDKQVSEQQRPTLLKTFLEIIKVSVYAICAIALAILLLTLRFGYDIH